MSLTASNLRESAPTTLFGVLVIIVGLLFLKSPGTEDVSYFADWIGKVYRYGLVEGYAKIGSVQPPLYTPLFWLIARCAEWTALPVVVVYKLSLFVAWLIMGLCLRLWTSNWAAIWAILLVLIPNTVALGYFDIYLAPLLLVALWAAKTERWIGYSIIFTVFAFMKGQGLLLIPFAVVFAITTARHHRAPLVTAAKLFVPGGLILVMVWFTFGSVMVDSFRRATSDNFFSGNALNVSWIITYGLRVWHPNQYGGLLADGAVDAIEPLPNFLPGDVMRVVFLVVYAGILTLYWRRGAGFEDYVRYSFVGFLAYFVLNTGVHENHLIYGAFLSLVLAFTRRAYLPYALVCFLAVNINMLFFYGLSGDGLPFSRVVGIDLSVAFAVVNLLFFLVCCFELFAPPSADRRANQSSSGPLGHSRSQQE